MPPDPVIPGLPDLPLRPAQRTAQNLAQRPTWAQNSWWRVARRVDQFIGVSEFSAELMRAYLPPAVPLDVVTYPCDCKDNGARAGAGQ